MSTVASLIMKFYADMDDLNKGIDGAEGKIGSFSAGVTKVAGAAALALGAGMVAAVADGVQGLIAMEDQVAQLDAVLASTGGTVGIARDELIGMAEAMQLTTKFAAEDTLAAENLLLTFTNIGKDVFPQATATMLDLATAMGTDAKGSAIQLGKALNDPSEGMSALTRVGVTFTEEQKKVVNALQESGDMAGAQKVILAELSKEFGGSAEAAGTTFSGQLTIAKNALGEVTESLAAKFMPALLTMLDWINDHMPEIQAVATVAFDTISDAISFIVDDVMPPLMKAFKIMADNWDVIGPAMAAVALMVIIPAFVAWGVAAATAATATIAALSPVLIPIAAVGLAVAGLALIWKTWGGDITSAVETAIGAVKRAFNSVMDPIKTLMDALGGAFSKVKEFFGVKDKAESAAASMNLPSDNSFDSLTGFATGGMVPGAMGAPMLAMVHGGEQVLTPAQQRSGGGGGSSVQTPIYISLGGQIIANLVVEGVVTAVNTGRLNPVVLGG